MWKIVYADVNLDVDEEKLVKNPVADLIKIKDLEVFKLKDVAKKLKSL